MHYDAEISDQVQQLFRINECNDHQLHCVLKFSAPPDPVILRKAFILSVGAIPILATRYIGGSKPRWAALDFSVFESAFAVVQTESEFGEFILTRIDEAQGPQVKMCFKKIHPFAIAAKMNHMICDAAGLKEFLYFFCKTYSEIIFNTAYRPPMVIGDRSMRKVLACFGAVTKLRALLREDKNKIPISDKSFLVDQVGAVQPFILTRKLDRERLVAIRNYGRARGATLNDVVLTAYYRCLFQMLPVKPSDGLAIPITVNMRRYLKENSEFTALTNLSSSAITRLEYKLGEEFENTLCRVKAVMNEKKFKGIGLERFIRLYFAYRIFGSRRTTRRLSASFKRHSMSMTNTGLLNSVRLSLGGLRPYDAFLCGSIKYRHHFQLAISSYEGELTFSVNLYGSASDRDRIFAFFDRIEAELPALA